MPMQSPLTPQGQNLLGQYAQGAQQTAGRKENRRQANQSAALTQKGLQLQQQGQQIQAQDASRRAQQWQQEQALRKQKYADGLAVRDREYELALKQFGLQKQWGYKHTFVLGDRTKMQTSEA